MNSLPGWLLIFPILLAIVAISVLPTILAALWEKRLVWPYVPVDGAGGPGPKFPATDPNRDSIARVLEDIKTLAPSHYTLRAIDAARRAGFAPLGTFADGKGRLYRIRYDFWLSGDGLVLALVGSGTIAGMPVQSIWLYTRRDDGRYLVTIAAQHSSEIDLAGYKLESLVKGADFARLLERHHERAADPWQSPLPYSKADPLGDHRDLLSRRVERLHELGYATYLDPDRTAWRYTPKGALAVALRTYATGMRMAFWPDSWRSTEQ